MNLRHPISFASDTLTPAPNYQGFVPCPVTLMAGMPVAHLSWMELVYQLAQAQAQASIPYRRIESYREILAEMPTEWRN